MRECRILLRNQGVPGARTGYYGAAVTVVMSMTNMLILYRRIEEVTDRFTDSMGYAIRAGFLVVVALPVLLYGLWCGVVQVGRACRTREGVGDKVRTGRRE